MITLTAIAFHSICIRKVTNASESSQKQRWIGSQSRTKRNLQAPELRDEVCTSSRARKSTQAPELRNFLRERERERLRKLQSGAEPATAASSVISLLHARGTISSNTCASHKAAQSGRGTGGIEHRNASFRAAQTPTAERARAENRWETARRIAQNGSLC